MAMSTASRAKARAKANGASRSRLRRPATPSKSQGGGRPPAAAKSASGRRSKPNPILLGGLGLVALVGIGRVAMPSMFGGGGSHAIASLPPPLTNRHLVHRATATTIPGATSATTAPGRQGRDPFTPPSGFGTP